MSDRTIVTTLTRNQFDDLTNALWDYADRLNRTGGDAAYTAAWSAHRTLTDAFFAADHVKDSPTDVCEWLISLDNPLPSSDGFQDRRVTGLKDIIARAAGALDRTGVKAGVRLIRVTLTAAQFDALTAAVKAAGAGFTNGGQVLEREHLDRAWTQITTPDSGVKRTRPTQARELCEWIVALDDDDPDSHGRAFRRTATMTTIIERANAALTTDLVAVR